MTSRNQLQFCSNAYATYKSVISDAKLPERQTTGFGKSTLKFDFIWKTKLFINRFCIRTLEKCRCFTLWRCVVICDSLVFYHEPMLLSLYKKSPFVSWKNCRNKNILTY